MAMAGGKPIAYTPTKTRKYEAALSYAARAEMEGKLRLLGPLEVEITAALPIPQSWSKKKQALAGMGMLLPTTRPDVDNYAKAAIDAMNAVVFNDDSQIVKLTVSKVYSDTPALHIKVTRLGDYNEKTIGEPLTEPEDRHDSREVQAKGRLI